jgi:DNA-binding transcriptional LysR family regulator
VHRQNDDAYGIWRLSRGRATHTVKVRGTVASNDGDVVLGWALDGTASCCARNGTWPATSTARRLRVVLADYALAPADLYAYYPSRHQLPAKVRAFINFLGQRLQPDGATGANQVKL